MKIKKSDLLAALKIANKVASKSSSFPILGYGKFGDGCLRATDLEIGVEIPIETGDETLMLPLKRLTDIVKSLENDIETVEISAVEDSENHVDINGLFEVWTMPIDDFPEFEIPETSGWATVGKTALQNVVPATTQEEAGFKLSGVYFDVDNGKAVATDGHRLHMEPVNSDGCESFMVGASGLKMVVSSLGKDEDEITLKTSSQRVVEREASDPPEEGLLDGLKKADLLILAGVVDLPVSSKDKVGDLRESVMAYMTEQCKAIYSMNAKNVVVKTENATFVMRPLEIKFPDYAQIIPETPENSITINRGEFMAAVKQAITMTNERYQAVKLTFNGKSTIEMESVNPDVGTYRKLTVPMTGHVDPQVEAGFNPFYLRTIMEVCKDNDAEFTVGVNGNTKPLTFSHGSFEGLVMPMRV